MVQEAHDEQSNTPRGLIVWALLCSLATAAWLHSVHTRADAGWIGLFILAWGVPLVWGVRGRIGWVAVAGLALATRLPQVGATPTLSDDLFRYLFEGLALNQGYNPFVDAPASLSHLAPDLAAKVNHAEIPSIYPPIAQLWFRLLAAIGTTAWIAQLGMALVDTLNALLVHRVCRRAGRLTWPAALYALHPLPVLESAHGAHLEPLAVAACLGAVLWMSDRPRLAGGCAALGVGIKLLPVLFLPTLYRSMRRRDFAAVCVTGGAVLFVASIPVLSAGPALLGALSTYTSSWSFNGLTYPTLSWMFGPGARPLLLIAGIAVAIHAATLTDSTKAWREIGAAFLFLSPTVHPWYLLWAFTPALLLGGRAWPLAALFLQASYAVLLAIGPDGSWHEPRWLGPITWGPALLILGAHALRDWRPTAP